MGIIADECRRESHEQTDKKTRCCMILDAWNGDMTAREILAVLPYTDMNAVRPRITELVQEGRLVESGSKYDTHTKRKVTCWRKTERRPNYV